MADPAGAQVLSRRLETLVGRAGRYGFFSFVFRRSGQLEVTAINFLRTVSIQSSFEPQKKKRAIGTAPQRLGRAQAPQPFIL